MPERLINYESCCVLRQHLLRVDEWRLPIFQGARVAGAQCAFSTK
jgi:hypothetical protein